LNRGRVRRKTDVTLSRIPSVKILVCVKQVPDTESAVRVDASRKGVILEGSSSSRMNRFDEFAVEEALLIKESFPGTSVEAITVGPLQAGLVVKRAIGMGADRGIHLVNDHERLLDPVLTAGWIAGYAVDKGYHLVLAGVMSEDYMQGQVGPFLAELLSIPCATSVISEQISPSRASVRVERETEGGYRELLEIGLPAVLTVQSGINTPRYPSLSHLLRAREVGLECIETGSPEGGSQKVLGLGYPKQARRGLVIEGRPEEKASRLLQILSSKALLH
jgi:electron transfer flavoprotein beta subunit